MELCQKLVDNSHLKHVVYLNNRSALSYCYEIEVKPIKKISQLIQRECFDSRMYIDSDNRKCITTINRFTALGNSCEGCSLVPTKPRSLKMCLFDHVQYGL